MGIYNDFFDKAKKEPRKNGTYSFLEDMDKKKRIEEEMDSVELEEWEKEEVRNGNFDPIDFEEEDLDEDSYHYDDD